MKKQLFLLLLVLSGSLLLKAQTTGKMVIGIVPFSCSNPNDRNYASVIHSEVVQAFTNSGRFIILDRGKIDELEKELNFQKSEIFLDSKVYAEQGKAMGAQYLLQGNILPISCVRTESKDYKTGRVTGYYYVTTMSISIRLTDLATGEVLASQIFKADNKWAFGGRETPEISINHCAKGIPKLLNRDWINKVFVISSKVLKVLENTKKGAAKTILISAGSDAGLDAGTKLRIVGYEMVDVGGTQKKRTIDIGTASIVKVNDESFSEAKVTDGGEEISKKLSEGAELTVISTN